MEAVEKRKDIEEKRQKEGSIYVAIKKKKGFEILLSDDGNPDSTVLYHVDWCKFQLNHTQF